jgi:hypothetical protein
MKPLLFALWLLVSSVLFAVGAGSVFTWSGAWLLGVAVWAVAVVPLSFQRWFAARRRHEEDDTEAALRGWSARAPGAGALLATAVDEALEEEDERSLEKLVRALELSREESLRAERDAFVAAARTWLADEGGRSSREAHLEQARARARPLAERLRVA